MFIILSVDYRDFRLYVCPGNRQRVLFFVCAVTNNVTNLIFSEKDV